MERQYRYAKKKKKNLKGSKLEYTKIKNIVLIKRIMKFL